MSETSSSLPEDPKQQAKRLFSEAEERYLAGDLAGALVLMRELHQRSGRPELLVNLGDLERELHHCVDARRYYEAYLASAKTGTKRERALRFKLELERECPEPAAVQARPVTVPPKSEKPGWSTLRIAGWSSLGATAVLGVAATYFALEAARDENRLEARIRSAEGGQGRGFSQADQELEADGQRAAGWAKGFAVGAAGLAATGISLLLLDAGHADRASSSLSLGWQAGSPRAVYQASF